MQSPCLATGGGSAPLDSCASRARRPLQRIAPRVKRTQRRREGPACRPRRTGVGSEDPEQWFRGSWLEEFFTGISLRKSLDSKFPFPGIAKKSPGLGSCFGGSPWDAPKCSAREARRGGPCAVLKSFEVRSAKIGARSAPGIRKVLKCLRGFA